MLSLANKSKFGSRDQDTRGLTDPTLRLHCVQKVRHRIEGSTVLDEPRACRSHPETKLSGGARIRVSDITVAAT